METFDELVERVEGLERQARAHAEMQEQWAESVNELNNLVAAMKGHAQLAAMQPSEEKVSELINVVQTSATRIQELIRVSIHGVDRHAEEADSAVRLADPSSVSILIVDDEALIRSLLNELLIKSGYSVSLAGSGEEAIAACKDTLFDLILMDFRLGDMNGVQALRKIREFQTESRVVFLTGDPSIEEIQATVRKEGADGFITKPFDLKEITDAIQHILLRKGA